MKNEGKLYLGVNMSAGAGGKDSFQIGAAEHMRFRYRDLSFSN